MMDRRERVAAIIALALHDDQPVRIIADYVLHELKNDLHPEAEHTDLEHLEVRRSDFVKARDRLVAVIEAVCPADKHAPRQHRDGKAPWCDDCGRTQTGLQIGTPRVRTLMTRCPESTDSSDR